MNTPMLIERTTLLPCSAERCLTEVQTTRLLLHIAWPLVRFIPVEPKALPTHWEERSYLLKMRLFAVLPLGNQQVNMSGRDHSGAKGEFHVELNDRGSGSMMRAWHHRITIRAVGDACSYTDRIEIEAGLLTPLLWLFTWWFVRHRHRRWVQLVKSGFNYGRCA